jgi:hypothetical protein
MKLVTGTIFFLKAQKGCSVTFFIVFLSLHLRDFAFLRQIPARQAQFGLRFFCHKENRDCHHFSGGELLSTIGCGGIPSILWGEAHPTCITASPGQAWLR